MQITLQDVLNMDVMKCAKVRTSSQALHKKPVESVSVIELPVEDFVRKNELVLTTAMGCGQHPEQFLKFVQDVWSAGASALAVATGRHVLDIPDLVLHFAETHEFPIIEIPWEVRFADITQGILSRLHNWHQAVFKRSEELQKQLLHFFLNGGTLSDAAEAIHQVVGSPVVILDKAGNVKGKSQQAGDLIEKWNQFARFATSPFHLLLEEAERLQRKNDAFAPLKIQYANRLEGCLLIAPNADQLAESERGSGDDHILEHALTALALWFQRENAIQETEMRIKDDFIWSLAKGEIESWDTVLSRAKFLGYNVNLPYVCIIGYPENMESLHQQTAARHSSYEHWLPSVIRSIEEQISEAGEAMQRAVMTTYQQDRWIIFLETPLDRIQETVSRFFDLLNKRLNKLYPDLIISWGIGENHAGMKTFHESFHDAKIALEIGRHQKGPGHRSTYANTGIFRALLQISQNPEIQEIMLSTIGALVDYDKQRGLDLVNTLAVYIRNQCNVSQTSRALNLHRQSLLYRLRKIETLSGRSLQDPDDLFLLDLSVKLWTTGLVFNGQPGHVLS